MSITGYRFVDGAIVPFYGAGGPVTIPDRNSLVRGTYIPSKGTTGPLPGTVLTPVEAGPSGRITITDNNTTFDSMEFWGQVYVTGHGNAFTNCVFRGADPAGGAGMSVESSGSRGVIRAYSNSQHFILENCLIDPDGWITERERSWRYIESVGIHGGDFEMRWCEITNVGDGISHVATTINPKNSQYTDVDRCWIHKGAFVNDWPTRSGGQPHDDAIQSHTGKHVKVRGCMLGGIRDMAGYLDWGFDGPTNTGVVGGRPTTPDGLGRNTGEDFSNAVLMLKQEVDDSLDNRLEDWIIEDNFIAGAAASVNLAYSSTRPGQKFASFTIQRNRFFERGATDGVYMWSGVLTDDGPGFYIIRDAANTLATFSDNTIWDPETGTNTGVPVPVTNG